MTKVTQFEKQNIIKSLLNLRCKEGATVADIQDDYENVIGKSLTLNEISLELKSMNCTYCSSNENNELRWYVQSDKSEHIKNLIIEQKETPPKTILPTKSAPKISNNCFFKDNILFNMKQKYNNQTTMKYSNCNAKHEKSYRCKWQTPTQSIDAQLVGDIFFRKTFASHEINGKQNYVKQTGLCINELSIRTANELIAQMNIAEFKSSYLILNVGSIDIIHGTSINDMCLDFIELLNTCETIGVIPILTTLAPFVNDTKMMRENLLRFNCFLLDNFFMRYHIIDIWSKLTKCNGLIEYANIECVTHLMVNDNNHLNVMPMLSAQGKKLVNDLILRSLRMIFRKKYVQFDI